MQESLDKKEFNFWQPVIVRLAESQKPLCMVYTKLGDIYGDEFMNKKHCFFTNRSLRTRYETIGNFSFLKNKPVSEQLKLCSKGWP